tara:strand:+ start:204 stop:455 length:252 start_codon:yes stop_codon:yes gene_type:complete
MNIKSQLLIFAPLLIFIFASKSYAHPEMAFTTASNKKLCKMFRALPDHRGYMLSVMKKRDFKLEECSTFDLDIETSATQDSEY